MGALLLLRDVSLVVPFDVLGVLECSSLRAALILAFTATPLLVSSSRIIFPEAKSSLMILSFSTTPDNRGNCQYSEDISSSSEAVEIGYSSFVVSSQSTL